jgi:hypothetical protein
MLKLLKTFSIALAVIVTQFIASAGEINFYSSGSTGVDGPFAPEVVDDLTGPKLQGSVPPGSRVLVGLNDSVKTFYVFVPLPQNGVFNFTTFNLPANHVMAFDTRGTTNPGVVILGTGNITIGGIISVTSGDTWLATRSNYNELQDGTTIRSTVPGPGGYRGGLSGGFGANQFGMGPLDWPPIFTLPLVGGAGGFRYENSTGGGGGTIIVASSGKVIFEDNIQKISRGTQLQHFDCSAKFYGSWMNRGGNYGPREFGIEGYSAGTSGSLWILANETKGKFNHDYSPTLVCAFEQEVFYPNSMSPPWPVGVRGGDMPVNPAARFVEFAGKSLTAEGEPDRVVLEKSGEYKLALETRNLPPGIVFVCTLRRLNPSNGSEIGKSMLNFPPSINTAAGVCRAEMMIPITPGGTYITAVATKPIETVYSPIIHGEPLTEMVAQLDLQGGQTIHFKTASGRQVDSATAYREALKQGKTRFPAFKS